MHHAILAIVGLLAFSACSSAMKQTCEGTNWFDHGRSVALSGRRLDSDSLAKNCQKEDVPVDFPALDTGFKAGMSNYCLAETVYANGRQGVDFNPGLCDGSNIAALKGWHQKGIGEYCLPDNGYRVGAQGKELRKVCPAELAPAFESRHSQGRVIYLNELAQQKEREVALLAGQLRDYRTDLFRKEALFAGLPHVSEPRLRTDGKPAENLNNRQRAILQQREMLSREIGSLQQKVEALRSQQVTIQQQISEFKSEAAALDQAPGAGQ